MAEGNYIQNADGSWSQLTQVTGSKVAEGIADFRLNTQGTLLASAARTAIVSSPTQINYNSRGVMVFLNVTAVGAAGGLLLTIQGYDPVTNVAVDLNAAPTAVTATGWNVYTLYPGGISGGSVYVKQRTSEVLPRTWRVQVSHANTDSYTYSVGYSLIL